MKIYKQIDCAAENLCPVCSSILPVHPVAGRPSVYCSVACKQYSYRHRKTALRISKIEEKPLRNSKKVIGASGTVHRVSVVSQSSESPVIRNIDDLKSFFCG